MTGIPDDAIRVRLAVDVPCQQGRDAMSCANWYGNDVGCHDCHRDLTCTVVTDVEVSTDDEKAAIAVVRDALDRITDGGHEEVQP